MLVFTMALVDVAARAAGLPGAVAGARRRSRLRAVCDGLDRAVHAAGEVTVLLGGRVGGEASADFEARAGAALAEQTAALTDAGWLLRDFVPLFGAVDGDLYARAAALVGDGVNVVDSLARIIGEGRIPLGPSDDEIAALAWRSRGPDTASRLSRQSRMVAGAGERWRRAAPPVRGEWHRLHHDEAARWLRSCRAGEGLVRGRGALRALRAELEAGF